MNKFLFGMQSAAVVAGRHIFSFLAGGAECAVCGNECGFLPVCPDCRKKKFQVRSIGSGVCRFCGKELISENDVCMECRKDVVMKHLDGAFPVFSYRLWNTSLLCRWKLENERIFSDFFAGLMNERLIQLRELKGKFVVVPVPPRPGKIKAKGWDQIDEISRILEFRYGWNVRRVLERHNNVEQKTLERTQRMEMIGKAYSLNADVKVLPDSVCLVDDVLTTGSTIESCAEKLKESGCGKVFAVALFSVDR